MAIHSSRWNPSRRRDSPPYDDRISYAHNKIMNPEFAQWNNRIRDLDAAWAASRNHSAPRYSPQRNSSNPIPCRTGYGSPISLPSHTRSFSRPNSRPTSSHASDGPPPAPPPPPLSFISHVQNHRRRTSQPKESPRSLSRRVKPWPPEGYSRRDDLRDGEAERLIGKGASTFRGYEEETPHTKGAFRFFAIIEQESNARTDRCTFEDPVFEGMTLPMTGHEDSKFPWTSLEQPSMGACFGKSPGTTTLTYYVGRFGSLRSAVSFGSTAKARKMKLIAILDRLRDLQMKGLEDDGLQETYHFLYTKLIEDPEAETNPHYDRAMQIADLLTVLSNPEWTDFSKPRNQVVAKFFDAHDEKTKRKFFHQLLLAIELHLRIESPEHENHAKRALIEKMPPKVAWDLAVAQRWLENMSIERSILSDNTQSTFTFTLLHKNSQKEALRNFATSLKWPNMDELEYVLEEEDPQEKPIEDRSAETMSWFTGVILPGATLPWLLMNSLIDCDRDTGDELAHLTHTHENAGFQYRANTYWSSQCIVGKVLGASRGVKQIAGWIGPCHYTPELERLQSVLVRQLEPLDPRLTIADMETMFARTQPLGPEDEVYPIGDYDLLLPDTQEVEDIIRIQKLSFNPHKPEYETRERESRSSAPRPFDAAIVFAFAGESLSIKLRYNVHFVNAFPCAGGPHPLYFGYKHKFVKVDGGLTDVHNWGGRNGRTRESRRRSRTSSPAVFGGSRPGSRGTSRRDSGRESSDSRALTRLDDRLHPHTSSSSLPRDQSRSRSRSRSRNALSDAIREAGRDASPAQPAHKSLNEVLVIEAFGVSDNEVFARAWCARWGVSAIVANIRETCVACAVREAYAACLSVVILTEGGTEREGD